METRLVLTQAQQNFVFQAEGQWIWTGTRWGSAQDGLFAHDFQTWLPFGWDDSSDPPVPAPLLWHDFFELPSTPARVAPTLVLVGEWEVVSNYTTQGCPEKNTYGHGVDYCDSMPTAWFDRSRNETVLLSANGGAHHPNVGPTLGAVEHDCSRVVFQSTNSPVPSSYANHQWV